MAQINPVSQIPADGVTTGALQVNGTALRVSARSTAGDVTLALLRMNSSGKWFRATDVNGQQTEMTLSPGVQGNTDFSFTLPAEASGEYFHLLLDGGSSFSGYAEMLSLSAPAGPGGEVPEARAITGAGGVTGGGDLSTDRVLSLGGTEDMTLSTGALTWAGAAGKAGSLLAGTGAALTVGANAAAVASIDAGGLGLVLAANKNLSGAAGTGAVNLSAMTGTYSGPTGLNTINGDLLLAAGKILGFGAPQALSGAGAVNVTTLATLYTSVGAAEALTLANGTQAGQMKFIMHIVDGGSGILTPATPSGFATVTFTNVRDWAALIWTGAAWAPLAFSGAVFA